MPFAAFSSLAICWAVRGRTSLLKRTVSLRKGPRFRQWWRWRAQRDVDHNVLRELLGFVENRTPFAKIFLDCRWESFWHTVLSFLDHMDEQSDAWTVVNSVLHDDAIRETLSVLKFCHFDFDKIIENLPEYTPQPQPKYPAKTWEDEEDLKNDWPSTSAHWISDRCRVSFDKNETISLLEQGFSTILEESAKEPYEFRQYLDLIDSRSPSTYHLTAILRAAESESIYEIEQLIADIGDDEETVPHGQLSLNVIGKAIASDVIFALLSDLSSYAWPIWQTSLRIREFSRTVAAIAEYVHCFGTFPPDLDTVVARGYLKSLPRDPYSGNALCYEPSLRKIYVDGSNSEIGRFCLSDDKENPDYAWYINMM